MGNLSKIFYLVASNKSCQDFIHPGMSCSQSAPKFIVDALLGSMKYYFPGCFVSLSCADKLSTKI